MVLKNILVGDENRNPNPSPPWSYLLWEYTSSINYTSMQFHPNSNMFFRSISRYPDKSYTIMDGNGPFEIENNVIRIYFNRFSIFQGNELEWEKNNLIIELEIEIHDTGMLVRQISGKKILFEDYGGKVFDFNENWYISLER